jgi:hypothetical protein
MIKSFMTNMDLQYSRIDATIETGEDPGEVDPSQAAERARGTKLPPELQSVVDRVRRRLEDSEDD